MMQSFTKIPDRLSVTQTARLLGVSKVRVRKLIHDDRIAAEKIGSQWVVDKKSAKDYARNKKPVGQPSKKIQCPGDYPSK